MCESRHYILILFLLLFIWQTISITTDTSVSLLFLILIFTYQSNVLNWYFDTSILLPFINNYLKKNFNTWLLSIKS